MLECQVNVCVEYHRGICLQKFFASKHENMSPNKILIPYGCPRYILIKQMLKLHSLKWKSSVDLIGSRFLFFSICRLFSWTHTVFELKVICDGVKFSFLFNMQIVFVKFNLKTYTCSFKTKLYVAAILSAVQNFVRMYNTIIEETSEKVKAYFQCISSGFKVNKLHPHGIQIYLSEL